MRILAPRGGYGNKLAVYFPAHIMSSPEEKNNLLIYREILGIRVNVTNYRQACELISHWAKNNTSCYVIAANVHVIMTGYWQKDYQTILKDAKLVTADGMPLVWGLQLLGAKQASRVYGPDLMLACCHHAAELSIPIYLYGGTESMLAKLENNLKQKFPQLVVAGSHSPPFHELTVTEETLDVERIVASGAKIVFLGLGCPKQEKWMARQLNKLPAVMLGVGAAFSFHSKEISQAPRWMMKLGLEWFYRLSKEPQRLWKRYLINNPAFLVLFGFQLLKRWFLSVKIFK